MTDANNISQYRQAAQEPTEDATGYREGQGCQGQEGEISVSPTFMPPPTLASVYPWGEKPTCGLCGGVGWGISLVSVFRALGKVWACYIKKELEATGAKNFNAHNGEWIRGG